MRKHILFLLHEVGFPANPAPRLSEGNLGSCFKAQRVKGKTPVL